MKTEVQDSVVSPISPQRSTAPHCQRKELNTSLRGFHALHARKSPTIQLQTPTRSCHIFSPINFSKGNRGTFQQPIARMIKKILAPAPNP